jgi:hypothetical protein
MTFAVYAPFVISAILGALAPVLSRGFRPPTAVRLLLAVGVVCALTSALALGALTLTLVGQVPAVASAGGWSARSLHTHDPVAAITATAAGLTLTGVAALLARTCVRLYGTLTHARRACRRMSGEPGGMVVIDDPRPEAYAVPAGALKVGRIVVSSGMLRALTSGEREALLAHETAHLRHRHHLYRMLATAVASLNPLLAWLPRAVEYATERWADEEAAVSVGDRRVVARALASAALAGRPRADGGLAFGRQDVGRRVSALLAGPPAQRPLPTVALGALLIASLITAHDTARDADQLFDQAQSASDAEHPPLTAARGTEHSAYHPSCTIRVVAKSPEVRRSGAGTCEGSGGA